MGLEPGQHFAGVLWIRAGATLGFGCARTGEGNCEGDQITDGSGVDEIVVYAI